MRQLADSAYHTPEKKRAFLTRLFPSLTFYLQLIRIVQRASSIAKAGHYDDEKWAASSFDVLDLLEKTGLKLDITGLENLKACEGPCVFIGNHMSMMETVLLPAIILPSKKVTFVVKQSLLEYPIFKHVMRSTNPVPVTRTNPRKDLKTVMTLGVEQLKAGYSVVVFPQTTRTHYFDPEQMSTIGIKLAHRANVPAIPIALKTDAWTNGKIIKDLGKLDLGKTGYFAFGSPINVQGKGRADQEKVNAFIDEKLQSWQP